MRGGRVSLGHIRIAVVAVTLVLFASAFPGIRAGLVGYAPAHLALLRFLIASILLGGYGLAKGMKLPRREDWLPIAAAGATGIALYHVLLSTGEQTVTSGAAALVVSTTPIFTALLGVRFLGEHMNRASWIGITVSFLGVTLIAMGDEGGIALDPGVLLVFAAAVLQAVQFVVAKPLLHRYSAVEFTTYMVWAGTAMLMVFSPGLVDAVRSAPLVATLSIVYLGVFPASIGYVTWTWILAGESASKAAAYLYTIPVLATVIAWLWLDEMPGRLALVGGAIALAGVVLLRFTTPDVEKQQ